ncbi:MBL fold metallo-hydrolase [Hyalangium rubrum]|uniref:MBL fold metallo-hydrolase n=1 Tax=Hyalangium rubrum TaxID=3103134 RepID=A0ABU5HGG0_9BACT|nr:MBL fold metallo-hydrolase [Hyalangium sp. s54d21]MDY7231912.1 MBL fold metallo-hydrolase [Hyalangium sp. s54d21]
MRRIASVLLFTLMTGCATTRSPEGAQVTLTSRADARVGTYVSSPWGFSTSSYWIEGPEGLILIDTQFLPSAAEEFVNWAEQMTGKKAQLAIVLHPNPDKFNGTDVLRKRGIRVVTSEQVRAAIPHVHEIRTKAFAERYKPDYPTEVPLPDSFGAATTELSAGGVTVKAHVMGAGCSEAHVVVEYEGHLFPGDMVANNAHSWLEIGKTDEWLKRVDEMKALKPKYVHPGRGPSGRAGLLDQEQAYLERVIAEVAAEKPQGEPTAEGLERIKQRILAAYPGQGFDVFLNIGLPAEWKRQAQAAAATK